MASKRVGGGSWAASIGGDGSMQWRPRSLPNGTATRAVLTDSPTHSQSSVTQAWRGTDPWTTCAIVGVNVSATSLIPQAEIVSRVSWRSFQSAAIQVDHAPAGPRIIGQLVPGQWTVALADPQKSSEAEDRVVGFARRLVSITSWTLPQLSPAVL